MSQVVEAFVLDDGEQISDPDCLTSKHFSFFPKFREHVLHDIFRILFRYHIFLCKAFHFWKVGKVDVFEYQIAFRHLFYQYADSLERFITYYIHDREKSQDLVLDIFTYIWENRQNFEIKLTLKAYLFQAARNKSFTYIRDKKIPVYLEEMEGMEIVQNYDSELELQELHHLIEEAVSLLPDKCREIFRKSREENLTNKE